MDRREGGDDRDESVDAVVVRVDGKERERRSWREGEEKLEGGKEASPPLEFILPFKPVTLPSGSS